MKYLLFLLLNLSAFTQSQKPNILFFLADDHQANLLSKFSDTQIITPSLDKLAQQGTYFSNAQAEIASCQPSRASIATATSSFTHKAFYPRYSATFNQKLLPYTWTQTFKNNGYETFWTGKWNMWGKPENYGIDKVDCFFPWGMGSHQLKIKDNTGQVREGFSSTVFADAAIRYIEQYDPKSKPFFMTVSFTAPHDPRTPPQKYLDMYDINKIALPKNFMTEHPFDDGYLNIRDEKLLPKPLDKYALKEDIAKYFAMITQMDAQIGRTIEALKHKGLDKNTIIIFAGDHGLAMGQHGLLGKFSQYNHSILTPLIFKGPNIPANVINDSLVYLYDIFPTSAELVGISIPDTVEGKSLKNIIHQKEESVREFIFSAHSNLQRSVRNKRFKLVRYYRDNEKEKGSNRYLFFDLEKDPHELKDLSFSPEHQEMIKTFKHKLTVWQKEKEDFLVK